MDPINIVIIFAEIIFSASILFAFITQNIFMYGRWVHKEEGKEYWYALIGQIIMLFLLIHFLGWRIF